MSDAMRAETVQITGHGDDTIEAYLSQPLDATPTGGVVVIHHMPGFDEGTKEMTRTFASGAIWPSARTSTSGRRRGPARRRRRRRAGPRGRARRPAGRATSAPPPPTCGPSARPTGRWRPSATARAAASPSSPPAVSTSTPPSTATALSSPDPPEGVPLKVEPDRRTWPPACPARCSDCSEPRTSTPSPEEVADLEQALTEAGKTFEFHSYEGAGHAFFATDRPSYRPEAAVEGWEKIWDFFGRNLTTELIGGRDTMCTYQTTTLAVQGAARARRAGSRCPTPPSTSTIPSTPSRPHLEHRPDQSGAGAPVPGWRWSWTRRRPGRWPRPS